MKKVYEAKVTIHATKEKVWSLLTTAKDYANWNPTVDKIEGTIAPNEQLKIYAKIAPGKAFPATVTEFVPSQRMVWSFSGPLGMFKGSRSFTLTEHAATGAIEFHTREEFGGWMSGLIVKQMPDLQPSFDEWAASLKRAAEAA